MTWDAELLMNPALGRRTATCRGVRRMGRACRLALSGWVNPWSQLSRLLAVLTGAPATGWP